MTNRRGDMGVGAGRRRRWQMNSGPIFWNKRKAVAVPTGAEADAADWVARLGAPDSGESDWLSFEHWLKASPLNPPAYDAALALWTQVDAQRLDLQAAAEAPVARAPSRRTPAMWGGALAACLAVGVIGAFWFAGRSPPAQVYQTAKGERRVVQLADGSRLDLNGGSRVSVRFSRGERAVEMADGEVAFDVTRDAARPFTIAVADRSIRVIGTQFNVLRYGGQLAVTVRRGVVQVGPQHGGAGQTVPLPAGRQFVLAQDGRQTVAQPADIDDAFSWKSGRLIYRDRPVADVVADLNRYSAKPVTIRGAKVQSLRFSGVLTAGDQTEMIGRLCDLLPLEASETNGAIVLTARESAR